MHAAEFPASIPLLPNVIAGPSKPPARDDRLTPGQQISEIAIAAAAAQNRARRPYQRFGAAPSPVRATRTHGS
jgi:hypothetical protein